jgi:hypothetical protein
MLLDQNLTLAIDWLPGDGFSDICTVSLAPEEGHDYGSRPVFGAGQYEISWRRYVSQIYYAG